MGSQEEGAFAPVKFEVVIDGGGHETKTCFWSDYNSIDDAIKGKKFPCPLVLQGDPLSQKTCRAFYGTKGYVRQHLEGKNHPKLPDDWKEVFDVACVKWIARTLRPRRLPYIPPPPPPSRPIPPSPPQHVERVA